MPALCWEEKKKAALWHMIIELKGGAKLHQRTPVGQPQNERGKGQCLIGNPELANQTGLGNQEFRPGNNPGKGRRCVGLNCVLLVLWIWRSAKR